MSTRYWSEASKERTDPAGVFYYWNGERPRHPDAPQLEGTGQIRLESPDRAAGYWTTRTDADPTLRARTSGVYLRADPSGLEHPRLRQRGGADSAHRRAAARLELASPTAKRRRPASRSASAFRLRN